MNIEHNALHMVNVSQVEQDKPHPAGCSYVLHQYAMGHPKNGTDVPNIAHYACRNVSRTA